MDYALAMAAAYAQMQHAWVAVFLPGALSLLALVMLRRTWTPFSCLVLLVAGTAITWLTARWTETPDLLGLHLQPAAFLLLFFAWRTRITQASGLAEAASFAACLAGLTWLSLLIVDVGACASRDNCAMLSIGGAGHLDMLVLGPSISMCAVLLLWAANRPRRQQAIA